MKRVAVALGALIATAGCGKKKPDFSRFIVKADVDVASIFNISIKGHPVKLERKSGVSGAPDYFEALVDFKESEVSSKSKVDVTTMTPCGEQPVELTSDAISKPNESNVVDVTLTAPRIKGATMVLFAPDVPAVKIGQMTFNAPVPRTAKIFNLDCVKEITVGSETAPLPAEHGVLVVAGSKQSCLSSGVIKYGNGDGCDPDSSEKLTGQLIYSLPRGTPDFVFEGVNTEAWSSSKCTNRTYIQMCNG